MAWSVSYYALLAHRKYRFWTILSWTVGGSWNALRAPILTLEEHANSTQKRSLPVYIIYNKYVIVLVIVIIYSII